MGNEHRGHGGSARSQDHHRDDTAASGAKMLRDSVEPASGRFHPNKTATLKVGDD
jgi:hypothetical protein